MAFLTLDIGITECKALVFSAEDIRPRKVVSIRLLLLNFLQRRGVLNCPKEEKRCNIAY